MYWKVKPIPQVGDKRTVIRIAFPFPIWCEDDVIVWFERVLYHQEFRIDYTYDEYGSYPKHKWITVRKEPVRFSKEAW